jgi:hypothetical protein
MPARAYSGVGGSTCFDYSLAIGFQVGSFGSIASVTTSGTLGSLARSMGE